MKGSHWKRRGLLVLGVGALAACTLNPYYDASKPHHTPEGFRNTYTTRPDVSFWRWQWERWRDGLPRPPSNGYRFPAVAPEVDFLRSNRRESTVTFVGHSTLLVQVGGVNVLTDPHLTGRASPVAFAGPVRRTPPGLRFEDLPHIDAVVVSHNHYDHLDEQTLERLARQPGGPPHYFVPLGMKRWFVALGISSVTELDWWESRSFMGLEIHCTPLQHWSQRTLWDRNRVLWGGWAILHPNLRFFFAGDTGYSADFRDVRARLGAFDLAAIPIGAYEPRWFMRWHHVDPAEAVRIALDLEARTAIGIHWGSFELTDEPLDEPPLRLARELERLGVSSERFVVLQHGETRRIAAPSGASSIPALSTHLRHP